MIYMTFVFCTLLDSTPYVTDCQARFAPYPTHESCEVALKKLKSAKPHELQTFVTGKVGDPVLVQTPECVTDPTFYERYPLPKGSGEIKDPFTK